ncbi:MAG: hypothetical protein ACLFO5_02125 [Opitutales bacterium]
MTDERFSELVNLYLDKEIEAVQLRQLRNELASRRDRRREFEERQMLQRAVRAALTGCDDWNAEGAGNVVRWSPGIGNNRGLRWVIGAGMAASLLVSLIGFLPLIMDDGRNTGPYVEMMNPVEELHVSGLASSEPELPEHEISWAERNTREDRPSGAVQRNNNFAELPEGRLSASSDVALQLGSWIKKQDLSPQAEAEWENYFQEVLPYSRAQQARSEKDAEAQASAWRTNSSTPGSGPSRFDALRTSLSASAGL